VHTPFHLVTESAFHTSYLVTAWLEAFRHLDAYRGVLVRDDRSSHEHLEHLRAFHAEHAGRRSLDADALAEVKTLYGELSETELAMIELYGVPKWSYAHTRTRMIGRRLNTDANHAWLEAACADEKPYVFVFLDRMLAPWWIDLTESRVVNAHSAVLPHARGMHAVEQVAATGDRERFLRSAGATVHYVDTGVDTGPIIAARRLDDALLHYSVWACKAETFRLAFSMLVRTAYDLTAPASSRPAGVVAAGVPDGEEFSRTTFTSARRGEAERAYLAMRGSRC
jgi:phosphoribosylglycinamide formyltransferase-1